MGGSQPLGPSPETETEVLTRGRWGDAIGEERQAILQTKLEEWKRRTDTPTQFGPFAAFQLTGADVFWLAITTLAGKGAATYAETRLREAMGDIDLAGAIDLSALHLEGADLSGAELDRAVLVRAHLESAILADTHLAGAMLAGTHFERANLSGADIQGAELTGARLNHANLTGALAEGAIVTEATLADASLAEAHFERAELGASHLERANLRGAFLEEAHLSMAVIEEADLAGANLRRADLTRTNLMRASLPEAQVGGALLSFAHLEGADFTSAHLDGSDLSWAQLQGADLSDAQLDAAVLKEVHLEGAMLAGASLRRADLGWAHVDKANLHHAVLADAKMGQAVLEDAVLAEADLRGADLREAHLRRADLGEARLEGADLRETHLEGARLRGARLQRANLTGAHLESADARRALLDTDTLLTDATLASEQGVGPYLAEIRWGGASLLEVDWSPVKRLADEREARQRKKGDGKRKRAAERQRDYRQAARAYRLLSVALSMQGLVRAAAPFQYRAEIMERKALFHGVRALARSGHVLAAAWTLVRWAVSWAFWAFVGYGEYFGRLALSYIVVVVAFAAAQLYTAHLKLTPQTVGSVLALSLTSLHGRGLLASNLHISDTAIALSAAEAVFGLVIEGLFIAAVVRRISRG
jgi:uncharacterized protein YjbI with pentapeptide repeats